MTSPPWEQTSSPTRKVVNTESGAVVLEGPAWGAPAGAAVLTWGRLCLQIRLRG